MGPTLDLIQEPPYFTNFSMAPGNITAIEGARPLAIFGDSVTTDHISPAGAIKPTSPAGQYLQALGVALADFNSYGARRGNDKVMVRGTFANVRIKNLMVPGVEGGVTIHRPSGEQMSIYDAAKFPAFRQCRHGTTSLARMAVRNGHDLAVNNTDRSALRRVPVLGKILTWPVDQFSGLTTKSVRPSDWTQWQSSVRSTIA